MFVRIGLIFGSLLNGGCVRVCETLREEISGDDEVFRALIVVSG